MVDIDPKLIHETAYSQAVTETKRAANAKVTTTIVRNNGDLVGPAREWTLNGP